MSGMFREDWEYNKEIISTVINTSNLKVEHFLSGYRNVDNTY